MRSIESLSHDSAELDQSVQWHSGQSIIRHLLPPPGSQRGIGEEVEVLAAARPHDHGVRQVERATFPDPRHLIHVTNHPSNPNGFSSTKP
ncbi:hypothetical protein J2X34_001065 [Rhodococcus sp. BE178]